MAKKKKTEEIEILDADSENPVVRKIPKVSFEPSGTSHSVLPDALVVAKQRDKEAKALEIKSMMKSPEGLTKLARLYTPRAMERLLELLESEDEKVAMAAIKELFSRGWGSATQVHLIGESSAMGTMTVEEKIEYLKTQINGGSPIESAPKEEIQLSPEPLPTNDTIPTETNEKTEG